MRLRHHVLLLSLALLISGCPTHDDGAGPPLTTPSITSQPTSIAVQQGSPAAFSVGAAGSEPLSYAWQRDGVPIPGATLPNYLISATADADSGAIFTVEVTNDVGRITSSAAILTVVNAPAVDAIVEIESAPSARISVDLEKMFNSKGLTGGSPYSIANQTGVSIPFDLTGASLELVSPRGMGFLRESVLLVTASSGHRISLKVSLLPLGSGSPVNVDPESSGSVLAFGTSGSAQNLIQDLGALRFKVQSKPLPEAVEIFISTGSASSSITEMFDYNNQSGDVFVRPQHVAALKSLVGTTPSMKLWLTGENLSSIFILTYLSGPG